ncbi:MAG: hypothetical protein NTW69_10390 [Chloroflexi bacterium]|nr:hypothetical protein [Chloroflexota bacterium]
MASFRHYCDWRIGTISTRARAAYSMIQDVLAGIIPEAWLFPASMDVFIGVTAVFVAIAVWKGKGLVVWTSAIIFFVLSISDHMDAMTVVLNTKLPLPAMMSGAPSSTAIMLTVMSIVELCAILALTSKGLRDHYLN